MSYGWRYLLLLRVSKCDVNICNKFGNRTAIEKLRLTIINYFYQWFENLKLPMIFLIFIYLIIYEISPESSILYLKHLVDEALFLGMLIFFIISIKILNLKDFKRWENSKFQSDLIFTASLTVSVTLFSMKILPFSTSGSNRPKPSYPSRQR